jgi:glycine cleavage system H protein
MSVPQDLKYAKTHEWVKVQGDEALVGITDHAQNALTDIVYVELPKLISVQAQQPVAVVESVKAASDIYSPVSGSIIAVNDSLKNSPGTLNQNPYTDGWIYKIKLTQPDELNQLMDASAYQNHIQ